MALIKSIKAYEIIDSKGYPALEARLELDTGQLVTSSVPGTHSQSANEASDVCDEDPKRFSGRGMLRAASYINDLIGPKLKSVSPDKISDIDQWLIKADGTRSKSRLGVNTLLVVSQVIAKASALSHNIPLFKYINMLYSTIHKDPIQIERIPTPIFNMINGGKHANTPMDFQEFQFIPSSSLSFESSYERGVSLLYELKKVLEYRNATTGVGEEGGFNPNLSTNLDALEILTETARQKKLKLGLDIFLGIDFASSFYFRNNQYIVKDRPRPLKSNDYLELIKYITENYPIIALEDPFDPEDWISWKKITSDISSTIYTVGDDLIRMSKERLEKAIKEEACTTFAVKLNQAGTITEALELIFIARQNKVTYTVATRTSDTNDDFLADFAVGVQSEFVKFGAPTRGERVAKYNRLWQIERDELRG